MAKVYFLGQCPLAVGTGMRFVIALHLVLANYRYVIFCYGRSGLDSECLVCLNEASTRLSTFLLFLLNVV